MAQSGRTDVAASMPVEESIREVRALLAEKARDPSIDARHAWDMLARVLSGLEGAARTDRADSSDAKKHRAAHLAIVRLHGGFENDATCLVTYTLVREFGATMLSDEGLRCLVECMKDPVA